MELAFDRHEGGGEGTVVLLHSLALDRHVWDGVIPHLTPRFDVLAVDLAGHGASDALDEPTIEDMADALAPFVREQAPDGAVVIGLSLGGCVAQAFAIGHPDLTVGLGLVDTTCWYGETAPADWEGRAQKAVEKGFDSLAAFQLDRWFSDEFNAANPRTGERLLDVFRANDVERYVATCRAMGAMDLRDRLGEITVPTCILVGEDDPATPPSDAEMMRALIDGAGMHVMPDCSHLSPVERPDLVARLLDADLFHRLADERNAA